MIYYDDLINTPYKPHGRDARTGLDCYGLVIECCKRAGTPLVDPDYERDTVPTAELNDYIAQGVNVREIPHAREGAIALMEYGGRIHVGYCVSRDMIIHATINKGVKVSHIALVNVIQWYEVVITNESEYIQSSK